MAFAQREPIGAARGDFQMAMLMALIANCHRDTKRRSEPFQPKDFLVDWDAPREEPGPKPGAVERVMAMAKMMTELFNAGKEPPQQPPKIVLTDS